jgi:putative Holliday junction resolvase
MADPTGPKGVLIAVDVGSVRVGIARCDHSRVLALPEATLARDQHTCQRIADLAREVDAQAIIIGLPLTMSGERGPAASHVEQFAAELALVSPCEVRLLDERLTTREAQRGLHGAGRDVRRSRAVIDQAAAVILLNHALDAERASGIPAGRRVNLSGSQDD